MARGEGKRPPLDQGFFRNTIGDYQNDLEPVTDYMSSHYGMDLLTPRSDSLERVMAAVYTDVFGGGLEREAFRAFMTLIKVFLLRLADTTNTVAMNPRRLLYRLVTHHLNKPGGGPPDRVTIITFNQDIQMEKALDAISKTKSREHMRTFAFPGCYRLNFRGRVTGPGGAPQFREDRAFEGIALLKLHGSLNWYSMHDRAEPDREALFDPERVINITKRRNLMTGFRVTHEGRKLFSFPIVIPPVVHKSGILHRDLLPVWALAEARLREADRIVIFGYSCPPNDWESANLLARCLTINRGVREIALIDPNPNVVLRYAELGSLPALRYYASCDAYLERE
jgi:hypothetical protein